MDQELRDLLENIRWLLGEVNQIYNLAYNEHFHECMAEDKMAHISRRAAQRLMALVNRRKRELRRYLMNHEQCERGEHEG